MLQDRMDENVNDLVASCSSTIFYKVCALTHSSGNLPLVMSQGARIPLPD